MKKIETTIKAISIMIKSKRQLIITILASIFMLLLAFYIPVLTIPGNSIRFQLSLLTWSYIILLFLFSILFGLSLGLYTYPMASNNGLAIANSSGAGFSSIVGSLFASKLCPICISTILGIVGLGSSALFLVSFKNEILIASIMILLISIYFGGKRVVNTCDKCL